MRKEESVGYYIRPDWNFVIYILKPDLILNADCL